MTKTAEFLQFKPDGALNPGIVRTNPNRIKADSKLRREHSLPDVLTAIWFLLSLPAMWLFMPKALACIAYVTERI